MIVTEPGRSRNEEAELEKLYVDSAAENLNPLWTQVGELMPQQPSPEARPHV